MAPVRSVGWHAGAPLDAAAATASIGRMFGFSIGKLLVLAVILVVVVVGFKLMSRFNAPQRKRGDESSPDSRIDTVYDPETDTYVVRDTHHKSEKK